MNATNSTAAFSAQLCSTLIVENSFPAKVGKATGYSALLLISLVGNVLLVVVVYKHRKIGMLTTTNCLIVNMAISDLIVPCFALPNKLYNLMHDSDFAWSFGGLGGLVLCKVLNFLLDVSTSVSIQSLVAIALERFYGILYPLRAVRQRKSKVCCLAIPLIWLSAIIFHGIYFYTFTVIKLNNIYYCLIEWEPLTTMKKAQIPYYLTQFSVLYICPLVLIAFLYGRIIAKLRASTTSRFYNKSRRRQVSENYRNRKVTKMCILAVLVFALCWAPIHVYSFCFLYIWDWNIPCAMKEVTFLVFFVAYSYTAINPCIFFTFNESFRRGLIRVLCCKSVKKSRSAASISVSWRSRSTSGMVKIVDSSSPCKENFV